MRIGRSACRQASTSASSRLLPWSSNCLANSTTRIAFLAARPISTTKPIWAKMLLSSPRHPQADDGRQQAHRHDQQDGQRQRPAFILRGQDHEHEQHGQREDQLGQQVLLRQEFLETQLGPLVAHRGGQAVVGHAVHDVDPLAGAGARGPGSRDLGGRVEVVVVDDGRARCVLHVDQRGQRHAVALGVADLQVADVLDAHAVLRFGLDVDLPVAVLEGEVVDVERTQR